MFAAVFVVGKIKTLLAMSTKTLRQHVVLKSEKNNEIMAFPNAKVHAEIIRYFYVRKGLRGDPGIPKRLSILMFNTFLILKMLISHY